MATEATEVWYDGTQFVDWLVHDMGIGPAGWDCRVGEHSAKELRRFWAGKKPISIWQADIILTRLALHVDLIPPSAQTEPPAKRPYGSRCAPPDYGKPYPYEQRLEVVRTQIVEGLSDNQAARRFGVNEKTVRTWAKRLRDEAEWELRTRNEVEAA